MLFTIKVILLLELLEVSSFFKQKAISGKQQVFVKTNNNNNNNENSNINNNQFFILLTFFFIKVSGLPE